MTDVIIRGEIYPYQLLEPLNLEPLNPEPQKDFYEGK